MINGHLMLMSTDKTFNMNVVEELLKEANKSYRTQMDDAEVALATVKESLATQDAEALEQLRHFGTSALIAKNTQIVNRITKTLEKGLLTYDQVNSICIKYRLKCLPARLYVKEVPLKALNDIKHYTKKHGIEFREGYGDQLFVIAPENHFKLGPRPQKDPVVLHQNSDGHFKVISTWGDDFSNMREFSCRILNSIGRTVFISCLLIGGLIANAADSWWWLLLTVPVSFGIAGIVDVAVTGGEPFDPFKNHK